MMREGPPRKGRRGPTILPLRRLGRLTR